MGRRRRKNPPFKEPLNLRHHLWNGLCLQVHSLPPHDTQGPMTIGESDDRQAWAHDIKNKGSSVLQPLRAFRVWPQSHWPHLMICSPSFSPFWLHKPSFCYSTISSSFQLQGLCTCWALHLKLFPIGPLHDWFCLFFLSGFSLNVTSSEIPSIISQLNAAPCQPKSPSN